MTTNDEVKLLKILVVGTSGIGKTSFIQRFVENTFSSSYMTTIGTIILLKIIKNDFFFNINNFFIGVDFKIKKLKVLD